MRASIGVSGGRACGTMPPLMAARARNVRVAIVVGRFHEPVTKRLLAAARATLAAAGVRCGAVETVWVPGAFEVPQVAEWIAARRRGRPDAIVALGCVIRGETDHHAHLGAAVVAHLLSVARRQRIPVGLGVVTARDARQALARAGGARGNRGADAAAAALALLALVPRAGARRGA